MQLLQRWRGTCAKVLAEQPTQIIVDAQRFGAIPTSVVDEHEPAIARLAIGRDLDQGVRRTFGGVELPAADTQARFGDQLEGSFVRAAQPAAVLVEPGARLPVHQLSRCDVLNDTRRAPRRGPVGSRDGGLRAVQCIRDRLHVDPRILGEHDAKIGAPVYGHELTQLGEERRKR